MDTRLTDSATFPSPLPPPMPQYGADGIQSLGQALMGQGVSVRATSIIMSSWCGATQSQYTTKYIKRWQAFCNEWQVNPTNLSLSNILDFLSDLYDSGMSYSALNIARSALCTIIMIQGHTAGSHPMIIRFLKGVYILRPTLSR